MRETTQADYQLIELQREIAETQLITAQETSSINIVSHFGLVPVIDGDQWCYLLGEDLQSGVCGFGDSPFNAAADFSKSFYRSIKNSVTKAKLKELRAEV